VNLGRPIVTNGTFATRSFQIRPTLRIITHAGISRFMGDQWRLLLCVCVRAQKGKRLELSTPNLVDITCMAVAPHTLTLRKTPLGQRSKSSDYEAAGVGMHVDRTYWVFWFSASDGEVVSGACQ